MAACNRNENAQHASCNEHERDNLRDDDERWLPHTYRITRKSSVCAGPHVIKGTNTFSVRSDQLQTLPLRVHGALVPAYHLPSPLTARGSWAALAIRDD